MSEQTDEVLQALGEKVRTAITVVSEIAEVVARHRMDKAREAQAASEAQRAEIAARLRAERDGAMPVMRQPWDDAWWRRAEPQEIAHVWQVTSGWTAAGDPYARTTLEHMRRQIQQRYGVSVPDQPVADKELALLLTPRPEAEQTGPGAGDERQEGVQGQYEYVVRDAANPDATPLAQGSLAADPGAMPADVAVQGLRQYAQGGPDRQATQQERIDHLFDVAYGRVSPARELSNVVIDVYPADQGERGLSTPLYSLEGARMEEVRAERRAERQRVIDGQSEASDEEILAAIALEERATREDLQYEQARAAAAGREPGQQVTWSISQHDFLKETDVSQQVATGTDVVPPDMSPELFAAEQLMHRVGVEGRVPGSYSIIVVQGREGSGQLAHIGGEQVEAIRAAQLPAYEAARAAGDGVDVRAVEQAQAELATITAAARERMGDLRLRREMAEARLRGESDAPVMWAERLHQDLDERWWETANPTEIAGVWDHVDTWPDGARKTAVQAQLQADVQRTHGVVVPPGASAGDVAAALERALDAQGRNLPEDRQDERLRQRSQDEEAAATASGERAEGMATVGEPVEDVRAEAEQAAAMRAAAEQDRQATAALADVGDREAADAVAAAAQGFSGTPSSRLAASQGKTRSSRPRPPRQSRHQERDRGGR
ncbi:hypothetical protein AB0C13_18925 [Streptomyces sp. NPDC049099]|uniref:hypothetical protein n=1 Tax=Streptomyces sp. NPDC049099 TaxID=3155768 RepID=UPI0034144249